MLEQTIYKKKKAILFVDDEILVLQTLKAQVKKKFGNQFQYEIATDAEEAWEVIRELSKEEVDLILIISDWLMPEKNGDEFLREVHEKFPNIKKIIISGQCDERQIEALFQEIKLFRFIRKPWDEEEIIQTVQESLIE